METCDIVDVLTRLRVSPDHHVDPCDNDPAKVVVNADDEHKGILTGNQLNPWVV